MKLSDAIADHLPHVRRYARALTGTQSVGDGYVVATLEALVEDPDLFPADLPHRVGLFFVFHKVWNTVTPTASRMDEVFTSFERSVGEHLRALTPEARQALLLVTLEDFSVHEAAQILGRDDGTVEALVADARRELADQEPVRVLIIEDEPIISMDLQALVEEMGHQVVGIATTRSEAVKRAHEIPPELVLADIQLADGSSGIDAVKEILADVTAPVIFITAFPERLLTGERPEPTFLISKPFAPEMVKIVIGQALFAANNLRTQG